jgi:hypothetical protein
MAGTVSGALYPHPGIICNPIFGEAHNMSCTDCRHEYQGVCAVHANGRPAVCPDRTPSPPEPRDSLIERDARQLDLIPSSQMAAAFFEESEARGEYTAEILFERHRDKYLACVSFLAEGIGILRIASLLHISPSSVLAVREREGGGAIEIEKGRLSRLARGAARLCVEAIVDLFADPARVAEINPRDLGILHGILIDKAELLSGGATARVLHEESAPGHADLIAYLDQLRARSTRLGGERGGQTGACPAGSAGAIGPDTGAVIDVTEQVQVGPPGPPLAPESD